MAVTHSAKAIFPDEQWEAGDRFEVPASPLGSCALRLGLPAHLLDDEHRPITIEDERGRRLSLVAHDLDQIEIQDVDPQALARLTVGALWLEFISANRYRLIVERSSVADESFEQIEFDGADVELLRSPPPAVSPNEFELGLRAARLATHPGFDQLISLPMVREMQLLEHQTRTAMTVLRRLRGRAMLCDEVGLGKTVEAGLVLSELLMRGLVRNVLVLTPPSLIAQWQGEMRRKFAVELISHDDPGFREGGAWSGHDRVIASIHTAKREPHRSAILARRWDMVIIDEAHHLRNRTTALWKFASELQKQYILLLTATPVQNNLEELFNLVTLLEPGLLSTRRDFGRRFVSKGDKLTPRNVDELHSLLAEVMVRNRRSTVGLQFTRRFAQTSAVALSPEERALYDSAATLVRAGLAGTPEKAPLNRMTLITLQMALGSSPAAAAAMLENLRQKKSLEGPSHQALADLAESAARAGSGAKSQRLLRLLDEFPDKLVVFTQFRATQEMLRRQLAEAGHEVAMFHGGLSRLEKEASIAQFRGSARILLCTESGSEGRNLQFAHGLCNFDLPWNPMKIEQRIGRLSRIGQEHDVHVFNLVAAGTVEAAVLHLLEAKLNMFELVIGEVDMILGNLDDEKEFEELIAEEWAASTDSDEFAARMEVLGSRLLAAKAAYFRQRAQDEKLFGNRFAPEG
ncbi:MAG TPA: SNF2-related protein [Humisphaera sp.]|nr:SNF2-related protein [Humisphaera sp.]